MKVCVSRRVKTDPTLAVVRQALEMSRLDVVYADGEDSLGADAECVLAFAASEVDQASTATARVDIPIVYVTDKASTVLHASDQLSEQSADDLEFVCHLFRGDSQRGRKVAGWINRQGGPQWTLAAVLTVLPTLVRRALADNSLPATSINDIHDGTAEYAVGRASLMRKARAALRRMQHAWTLRRWQVGVIGDTSIDELLANPNVPLSIRWLNRAPRACFWADPCSVGDEDQRWIFVEELDYRIGHGRIVGLRVHPDGHLERHVVLSDGHHRALPRVWRSDGRWLATVDTCQSPAPVFTFDALGDEWRPLPGCYLPPLVSDPVVREGVDGWQVTGSLRTEIEDAVCQTWTSPSGPDFRWTAEDREGRVDISSARGAGSCDQGRGVRAVQDCSSTYGAAVSLIPAPVTGVERVVPIVRLDGSTIATASPRVSGMHTLSWLDDGTFVTTDGWRESLHPLAFWRNRKVATPCRACTEEGSP